MSLEPKKTGLSNSLLQSALRKRKSSITGKSAQSKDSRSKLSPSNREFKKLIATGPSRTGRTKGGARLIPISYGNIVRLSKNKKAFIFVIITDKSDLAKYQNSKIDVVYSTLQDYVRFWGSTRLCNVLKSAWGLPQGNVGKGAWFVIHNNNRTSDYDAYKLVFKFSKFRGVSYLPISNELYSSLANVKQEIRFMLAGKVTDFNAVAKSPNLEFPVIYCSYNSYKRAWKKALSSWNMPANAKPGLWSLLHQSGNTKDVQLVMSFSSAVAPPAAIVKPIQRPSPRLPVRRVVVSPSALTPIGPLPSLTDSLKKAGDIIAFLDVLLRRKGEAKKLSKLRLKNLFNRSFLKTITFLAAHLKKNNMNGYNCYVKKISQIKYRRVFRMYGLERYGINVLNFLKEFSDFSRILQKGILGEMDVARILLIRNESKRVKSLVRKVNSWIKLQQAARRNKVDIRFDITSTFLRGQKIKYFKKAGMRIVKELNSIFSTTLPIQPVRQTITINPEISKIKRKSKAARKRPVKDFGAE
ncbi:MAG: hypothetical protein ABIE74_07020 [Pseudomonadota bacterium]